MKEKRRKKRTENQYVQGSKLHTKIRSIVQVLMGTQAHRSFYR